MPACDALFACCSDSSVLMAHGGTPAACNQQLNDSCKTNLTPLLAPLLATGASIFDGDVLAACVSKLQALANGGASCLEPPLVAVEIDCLAAFRGQVPGGGACIAPKDDGSFIECSHGRCLNGVCEPFLQAGDACDPGPDLCDYTVGLWCKTGGPPTGTCQPRGDIGAACDSPGRTAYECKSTVCGPAGTCQAPEGTAACQGVD
ncbi:MAG: hypothetical protein WKG00_16725 [Polyangiaceae bacterium]